MRSVRRRDGQDEAGEQRPGAAAAAQPGRLPAGVRTLSATESQGPGEVGQSSGQQSLVLSD